MSNIDVISSNLSLDESSLPLKYFFFKATTPPPPPPPTPSSPHTPSSLLARLAKLERTTYNLPSPSHNTPSIRRVRDAIVSKHLHTCRFQWVPSHYYTLSLHQRRHLLKTPSVHQLCKALLMENTKTPPTTPPSPSSSLYHERYYLIVLQYTHALSPKKLSTYLRSHQPPSERYDPSLFSWRLASDEDNARLTGYDHNAVGPFGLVGDVVVLVDESVTREGFVWMGGGHEDLKVGMEVGEFLGGLGGRVVVGGVSEERREGEWE